jgi:hypothetical protein
MAWTIKNGPRHFDTLAGWDIDGGWAYTLERGGETRSLAVLMAGGQSRQQMPHESEQARSTRGRDVVAALLNEDIPPRYVVITTEGLRRHET